MSAKILDGKQLAKRLEGDMVEKVAQRQAQGMRPPGLSVILVGEDPASLIYVNHKRRACERVGFDSEIYTLPIDVSLEKLLALIEQLNTDDTVDGILVQLPLPPHLDADAVVDCIRPDKDVDGFHPYNLGRLAQRRPLLRPCTPFGVMTLLGETQVDLTGIDAVVVGASNIVGRPMILELLQVGVSITNCHRFSKNTARYMQQADLVIVAIGKPGVIDSAWIKPGAIAVDIGINRLPDGRLTGDLDFETAKERAGWITPVPGGVGPMTVVTLLQNTLFAADRALSTHRE